MSYRNISRNLGITHMTVKDYIELLETLFLVRLLPAWRPGIGAREIHAPKGYVVDSGLLAHLLGADESRAANDIQEPASCMRTSSLWRSCAIPTGPKSLRPLTTTVIKTERSI